MNYTDEQLNKLQCTIKDILFKVDKICKKNGISYFAIAGTLLGAIRHQDIIPWDDDIDIGMMREDYNKFLEVIKTELPDDLICVNFETFKDVPAFFTKICKKDTVFVEEETKKLKYPHCVFLDVIPLDRSPIDEKKRLKHLKQIRFWHELFKSKTLWRVSSLTPKNKRIIGDIIRPLIHVALLPIPKKALYKKLNKVSSKYQHLGKNSYIAYKGKEGTCNPYEYLFPLKSGKFGSFIMPIPNKSHELLSHSFGDYMTPPPVEKRVSHSPFELKL